MVHYIDVFNAVEQTGLDWKTICGNMKYDPCTMPLYKAVAAIVQVICAEIMSMTLTKIFVEFTV